MAWTTPRTWVAGAKGLAAQMNTHLRDNLNFLYSRTWPLNQGGTGSTTASGARTALGLSELSTIDPPLPVGKGGTGSTTASDARTALGLGTAATKNTGTTNGRVPLLGAGGLLARALLGTGSDGNGNKALHDDGTWKETGVNIVVAQDSTLTTIPNTNVWADTGLEAAIEVAAGSKVAIEVEVSIAFSRALQFRVVRGTTEVFATANQVAGTHGSHTGAPSFIGLAGMDTSPTTGSNTYKLQARGDTTAQETEPDTGNAEASVSRIRLIESR